MNARLSRIFACALITLLVINAETVLGQTTPNVAQAVRDRVTAEGRARVIVELAVSDAERSIGARSAEQNRRQRSEIAAQRERLKATMRRGQHRVVHEFADAPYVALEIDASTLAELSSAASSVVSVTEDRLLAPVLMDSVPLIEADRAHEIGLNGSGTVIAVIDSGVDRTHPFFSGRLVKEACFSSPEIGSGGDCPNGQATQFGPGAAVSCPFAPSACRHGTHVAGIAVGAGSEFSGVAPGAQLIAIQVIHASTDCILFFEEFPCARAFASDIVAGLEYVLELRNQYNIAAVNMSLGGTPYDSACDAESPLFAAVINNLRSVGIATVAGSGNDGLTFGIAEPACIEAAISVGATTIDDELAYFSNNSADLDLLAPGSPITSSVPGGGFDTLEGTSMAAPHVAGAWAIYKQANPTASVADALATFVATGVPIADWRDGPTKPRINVASAIGIPSPAPTITSVSPARRVAYGPDFTLTVNGSDFVRSSTVRVNGVPQPTSYVSKTQLRVQVAADAIATTASAVSVTVFTPPPGGGTSNAASISIVTSSSIQVDATTVEVGDQVNVTVTDPPGWASDWVSLAKVGSPPNAYVLFMYVGSEVTTRTWSVTMPQTPGQYEFRLFVNNSYTQVAVSAPVTVTAPPPPEPVPATLTPSATSAAPGAPITVTLQGSPGGASDWLALARVGSTPSTYVSYTYVGAGVTNRTWTVTMPQTPGQYEFRLFVNNSYTQIAVSAPITVNAPPTPPPPQPGSATLTPSATSAVAGAPITVTLQGSSGAAGDWIALARVGRPLTEYIAYTYVGAGVTNRTWTVTMPQTTGQYEFRLFVNNGFTQVAVSAPVTVTAPPAPEPAPATLTPSATSAAAGAPVTVTLQGGPAGSGDWLALARVGSAPTQYVTYTYVGGVTNRTWTVTMPQTTGQYEFRLFVNNTYTQIAVSAPITVTAAPAPEPAPATLTPSATSAAPGAPVTVTLQGGPAGSQDWLALARVGSATNQYVAYTYVGGVTNRTWTVTMPQTPGQYEFRLFSNNTYTQIAVSAPVTVN